MFFADQIIGETGRGFSKKWRVLWTYDADTQKYAGQVTDKTDKTDKTDLIAEYSTVKSVKSVKKGK